MWFSKAETPAPEPGLTEELVQRVWDCVSRVKTLEDRMEGELSELKKRYQRADKAEQRREKREKENEDCEDCEEERHPAILALKKRQGELNGVESTRAHSLAR